MRRSKNNQRLFAFLKTDRQWRRIERIYHARRMMRDSHGSERDFWNSVLTANGATNRHIEPSTRWAMGDRDIHGRTGEA